MNLCIIGLLSPVYLFLIPSFKPQRSRTILSRLNDLDGAGTILSIGSLVFLVMAINFGGTLYNWNSAEIIVFFVLSGLLLMAFAVQQYFTFLTKSASRLFPVGVGTVPRTIRCTFLGREGAVEVSILCILSD